jgi:hypothetical protein
MASGAAASESETSGQRAGAKGSKDRLVHSEHGSTSSADYTHGPIAGLRRHLVKRHGASPRFGGGFPSFLAYYAALSLAR